MKLRIALLLPIIAALTSHAWAQPAYMVKDLAPQTESRGSLPFADSFATLNGIACFSAGSDPDESGLWRSDGTEAGTSRVVRSLLLGPPARLGQWLVAAATDFRGTELWRTDCTAGGTALLKDINPGEGSSWPGEIVVVNGVGFFVAYDGAHSRLWKTDGTEGGTQPLALLPDNPSQLSYAAGHFFFLASDETNGLELWKTDGTDASTMLVKDVRPGPTSAFSRRDASFSSPQWLYPADHLLFFAADDGVHGMELWRSDGTANGTMLVTDIVPGPADGVDIVATVNQRWLTFRDVVYFPAFGGNMGMEPWRSDGTAPGTTVLADLAAGPSASAPFGFPYRFTVWGDRVVFAATATSGPGIWITDGSGPGTVLLQDLERPAYRLRVAGDFLFFTSGAGSSEDYDLYRIDRTPGSAVLIKRVQSGGPGGMTAIPGGFLFAGDDPISGKELWKTDGTLAGTRLLRNINPDNAWGVGIFHDRKMVSFNGTLMMSIDPAVVFRSDGSAGGTTAIGIDGITRLGRELNGRLIFARYPSGGFGLAGYGVWSTDGTVAGTVQLKAGVRIDDDPVILNGRLFFPGAGSASGLWRTDGTSAGTVPVTETGVSYVRDIRVVDQSLYFIGYGPEMVGFQYAASLWRSDGMPAGTTRLAAIGVADRSELTAVNGTLFFAGPGGLWTSNRTSAGTGLLKSFPGGLLSLTNMDGTLMFVADDGVHGLELWRSDGTEAGTVLVRDINEGLRSGLTHSASPLLAVLGHQVLFAANDGTHGVEPWRSDGTASGTVLLKDIIPGPAPSGPQSLAAVDGMVLFSADDGVHGFELWRSDGSPEHTALMQDIAPGETSSMPADFMTAGPHIFFTAYTPDHGRELWAIERAPQFYPCTLGLASPTTSVGAAGGRRQIGIRATAGCGWTVTTGSSWVSVVAGHAGSGYGGATVIIAPNTTGSPRVGTVRVSGQLVTVTQSARNRAVASDFDADSRADVSVWRPATGDWWTLRSSTEGRSSVRTHWGAAGDVAVPGDYDGDGVWDRAVFRPSNGTWYIDGGATVVWGEAGDIPVPGDYNGDGITDIAVFSPGKGLFLIRNIGTIAWGAAGDVPVQADYNGDGTTDVAVFRPSSGTWYIRDLKTVVWGAAGDIPVAADYDGDGSADVAVFRPSNGVWYVMDQSTTTWGAAGDIPVPVDRDGDGIAELGIFRRATGTWYFQNRATGDIETVLWGAPGDMPLGRPLTPAMTITGDFDGDRRADLTVFTPSSSEWRSLRSMNAMTDFTLQAFGTSGDLAVARDYDGDGKSDFAVFRPSTGWWYVLRSSTNSTQFTSQSWGLAGDIPVPGDYDGDGKADFAVFRPSAGRWVILLSSTGNSTYAAYDFGLSDDIPVPADYDGDGRIDIAVFRPSTGRWYILDRTTGTYQVIDWGLTGDLPAPADFDGDGKADLTVFRPSLGQWFIKSSVDGTYQVVEWGLSGDAMVPADFNGDGKADVAVFRPSNATWYVRDQFTRVWYSAGDQAGIKIP